MQKENRKYYEAYEDRYKTAHEKGVSWEQMKNTPIVMDIINRYHLHPEQSLLEIGCGEGRDSATVLERNWTGRASASWVSWDWLPVKPLTAREKSGMRRCTSM